MLEQFLKDCTPWEGLCAGAGEEHDEEGKAEANCHELTTTPIRHPPALLRLERKE